MPLSGCLSHSIIKIEDESDRFHSLRISWWKKKKKKKQQLHLNQHSFTTGSLHLCSCAITVDFMWHFWAVDYLSGIWHFMPGAELCHWRGRELQIKKSICWKHLWLGVSLSWHQWIFMKKECFSNGLSSSIAKFAIDILVSFPSCQPSCD